MKLLVKLPGVEISADFSALVGAADCHLNREPEAVRVPVRSDFGELLAGIVNEMGDQSRREFSLGELAEIARARGCYVEEIGNRAGSPSTDEGGMTQRQKQAFAYELRKQCGKVHREIAGKVIEFGKRKEARTAAFIVSVKPSQA